MVTPMVCGIDPHKSTLTAVLADQLGRRLAARTVRGTPEGWLALLVWARGQAHPGRPGQGGAGLVWAVEDGRGLAGGLIRQLLTAGQRVVLVAPKLMARERRTGRGRGKSDPIDALAVARVALREPNLPSAHLDDQARMTRRWMCGC